MIKKEVIEMLNDMEPLLRRYFLTLSQPGTKRLLTKVESLHQMQIISMDDIFAIAEDIGDNKVMEYMLNLLWKEGKTLKVVMQEFLSYLKALETCDSNFITFLQELYRAA